jgi:catechol 2,3-dioxygenase-like lactoylglutathione lyase family enzyme
LRYLSFGAYAHDLPALADRLQVLGAPRIDPPAGMPQDGVWLRDPAGTPLQVRVAPKTSPSEPRPPFSDVKVRHGVAPKRSESQPVRPTRLSHVLLFSPDVDRSVDFYCSVLGLRLSDRGGRDIAFLHGPHGSDHHLVAFVASNGPGIHHTSWDVPTVHHVGLGAAQMAARGHAEGWGLGRHVLGSNYFHYVRDPWNSYAEYSAEMDFIAAGREWPAADHPAEDAFYVWGPQPPADFAVNHELDA